MLAYNQQLFMNQAEDHQHAAAQATVHVLGSRASDLEVARFEPQQQHQLQPMTGSAAAAISAMTSASLDYTKKLYNTVIRITNAKDGLKRSNSGTFSNNTANANNRRTSRILFDDQSPSGVTRININHYGNPKLNKKVSSVFNQLTTMIDQAEINEEPMRMHRPVGNIVLIKLIKLA
jgi:hypothetical protein